MLLNTYKNYSEIYKEPIQFYLFLTKVLHFVGARRPRNKEVNEI